MEPKHEPSLEDVQDFAANYSDRQGLRIVPLALAVMIQAFPRWIPSSIFGIDTTVYTLAIGFAGYWIAARLYRRSFGAVEERPREGMSLPAQLLLVGFCLFAAMAIDLEFRPPLFLSGLVIAAWLAITAWPSRRVRGQYVSIAVFLALISLAPLAGEDIASLSRVYAFCFGFLLLLAGVRDHITFLRFVTVAEEQHE